MIWDALYIVSLKMNIQKRRTGGGFLTNFSQSSVSQHFKKNNSNSQDFVE